MKRSPGRGTFAVFAVACTLLLPFLSALTVPASAQGYEHRIRHRIFRTKNLKLIYYDDAHSYVVPHLARCFENSFRYHSKLFDWTPSEPVSVQLQDFDDHGYAGTSTIPFNFVTIGIEPFEYVYDTCPTNERMNWVMNHEMVHVVACDQATGSDRFFRKIFFGKVRPNSEDPVSMLYSYLASPRYYAPRWYHEGIAVFMETWMAGGIGRAQSGYDEMVFRSMVRDSTRFYDIVGLESEGTTSDFQTGYNSYLYGTRFVSYLAHQYGPEKMLEWFTRDDGSARYFSSQFKKVYDVDLDDEWRRWVAWEHEWQSTNLDSIRRFPTTKCRPVTRRSLGSISRSFYDPSRGKLYVGIQYPGEFSHIAEIDVASGEMRKLCDITGPATYYVCSLAYDDETGTLFYTSNNAGGWRGLHSVDVETGETRELVDVARIGDLVFNRADSSLWGVQHHNGQSRLVRLTEPYRNWIEVIVLPFGRDVFDLDISPDGEYLTASVIEVNGRQRLVRMEMQKLLSFDASYEVLYEFPNNSPSNFVHSPDGRYLYGTSYHTGASNVFRYDLESGKMDAMSNAETGFFRPIVASPDSLIAFRYSGDGFVPVLIPNEPLEDVSAIRYLGSEVAKRHPVVKDWMIDSPIAVKIDSVRIESGDYSGLRNVRLVGLYPIAEGYKDYSAFGFRADLMDPAWIHRLSVAASYTPETNLPANERSHFRFEYGHSSWTIHGAYNRADFYDFFGPTKRSRQGYSLGFSYYRYLYMKDPASFQYAFGATGYRSLKRLPDAQNVKTAYEDFGSGYLQFTFQRADGTIGAIEAERGILATLGGRDIYSQEEHYLRANTNITYGFLLPWDHSSIWLRGSAGHCFGDRWNPFSNFFFGGFGNNWVDNGDINRYRQYYAFPGTELNAIAGQNYVKGMVEWTLPPLRFKRLGFPALYANWARLALFSTGIVTNVDDEDYRHDVVNFGGQLNLKLVIFSSLESTLSAGYAVSAQNGWETEDEFMVSLKILR